MGTQPGFGVLRLGGGSSRCRGGDVHSVSLRSGLPYEVSPEQALCHPEVRRRLDASVRALLAVTEKFVSAITSSVDQIPCVPRGVGPRPAVRFQEGGERWGGFFIRCGSKSELLIRRENRRQLLH